MFLTLLIEITLIRLKKQNRSGMVRMVKLRQNSGHCNLPTFFISINMRILLLTRNLILVTFGELMLSSANRVLKSVFSGPDV